MRLSKNILTISQKLYMSRLQKMAAHLGNHTLGRGLFSGVTKGFTLLEILLVVVILGVLASIVILAINPLKQLADTRNAQRKTDVNTILDAVYQYTIDNNGMIPSTIPTSTAVAICNTGVSPCTGLIDLAVLTNLQKYLIAMPRDPFVSTATSTFYTIIASTLTNRITVAAPGAENGVSISATR